MADFFNWILHATNIDLLGNIANIPTSTIVMLGLVVVFAIGFDFINGFHDTANSIATTVSTRVLSPTQAIIMAAGLNFVGALVSHGVAKTIASGLVTSEKITNTQNLAIGNLPQYIILAALIGAIIWNLITWYFGIPSSSSHALIGGLLGATITFYIVNEVAVLSNVKWDGVINKVVIPLLASPLVGFIIAFGLMKLIYFVLQKLSQHTVNGIFSKLQIVSAAFMAFEHGRNDAQKSMGIITLALVAASTSLTPIELINGKEVSGIPFWVMLVCAIAMGLGTATGGWKIIKTMGVSIIKLRPIQGFAAEATAATVITIASNIGAPISTTHVITSAVLGVGTAKRTKAVKWGIAKNIVFTWVLTIPATMLIGAGSSLLFLLGFKLFGVAPF